METMLLFIVDTLASNFNNIIEMMNDSIEKRKGKWFNAVEEYRLELGLTWNRLKNIDRQSLKILVRKYDTQKWKEGLHRKTSMRIYRLKKKERGYEHCYRNNSYSTFLAKARINSLQLEEHNGRGLRNYETNCKLCGEETEDIVHFLIKCKELENKRDYKLIDRNIQNPEERLRELLYKNKEHQEVGKLIKNLWMLRKDQINDLMPP